MSEETQKLIVEKLWVQFVRRTPLLASTAANRVDDDKKRNHDYVNNCHFPPVMLYVLKDPSLAWSAVEAKVVVVPFWTIGVCRWCRSCCPGCCIIECKTTTRRWLTTSWLQSIHHKEKKAPICQFLKGNGMNQCWAVLDFYEEPLVPVLVPQENGNLSLVHGK